VAWLNVVLHAIGLVFAVVAMRPGTPAAPLAERMAYLAARPPGWTAGWLVWMGCAVTLVVFMVMLARRDRSSLTRTAAMLAILGAVLDLACDAAYIVLLPARAAGDVSRFVTFERVLTAASLTGANGLYSIAVLVATLGVAPSAGVARWSGLLTFTGGVMMAVAGLTFDPVHVIVATAITIPSFLAWTLAVSSPPRRG
jgi:hypothetical protein